MVATKDGKHIRQPSNKKAQSGSKRQSKKRDKTVGRPVVITPSCVAKLEAAFQNGFNVTQACNYSGISTSTFYRKMEKDTEFCNKMTMAQDFLNQKAREVIAHHIIEGSARDARWWLERKSKDEFSVRNEVTGEDGGAIKTQSLVLEVNISDEELNDAIFGGR